MLGSLAKMQSEENCFLSSVCGIFWQGKRAGVLDSYFGKKKCRLHCPLPVLEVEPVTVTLRFRNSQMTSCLISTALLSGPGKCLAHRLLELVLKGLSQRSGMTEIRNKLPSFQGKQPKENDMWAELEVSGRHLWRELVIISKHSISGSLKCAIITVNGT